MKFPSEPREGRPIADDFRDMVNWLRASRITKVIGGRLKESPTGSVLEIFPSKNGDTINNRICTQFSEIIEDVTGETPVYSITGGYITCGDKTFYAGNYQIDVGGLGDGFFCVWIEMPCESNMDDDGELILPGIKTTSMTSISSTDWVVDTSFASNTNPTVESAGIGTIILPVGVFEIIDGAAANFVPSGCGRFNVTQCAGILGYGRGS